MSPSGSSTTLTFESLRNLLAGDTVAIRGHATLEPAGGQSDKVFPPTYVLEKKAAYARESRRINHQEVQCVLLDSVQSQANRMEEALEGLWASKRIRLPVVSVNLSGVAPEVGMLTSLSAPHRIADAILRDSLTDKHELFRLSEIGRSFTHATPKNAAPLFRVCPTGLLFGIWDSTGPKGGSGSKFARAIVSEVIGVGATDDGVKTGSRLDPTGVTKEGGVLYIKRRSADEPMTWTLDPEEAERDGNVALKWGAKKKDGKWKQGQGRPSDANLGNHPPGIDTLAGGVTIDYATHTVVISLAALRKLHFGGGDVEAQTVLAALGLLAALASESRGYDFRSRCLLVPSKGKALALETVARDGSTQPLALDLKGAMDLYNAAVAALPSALSFAAEPGVPITTLTPSPKLAHLIERSRELAAAGADIEED